MQLPKPIVTSQDEQVFMDMKLIKYFLQVFGHGRLLDVVYQFASYFKSMRGLDTLYNISLIIIIIKPPAGLTHYWINTWPAISMSTITSSLGHGHRISLYISVHQLLQVHVSGLDTLCDYQHSLE